MNNKLHQARSLINHRGDLVGNTSLHQDRETSLYGLQSETQYMNGFAVGIKHKSFNKILKITLWAGINIESQLYTA